MTPALPALSLQPFRSYDAAIDACRYLECSAAEGWTDAFWTEFHRWCTFLARGHLGDSTRTFETVIGDRWMSDDEYIFTVRDTYTELLGGDPRIISMWERPEEPPPYDLAIYPPTEDRPVTKMTTIGLSARPMPSDAVDFGLELAMSVPDILTDDDGTPMAWLSSELVGWAAFPFREETFIWDGHTLAEEPLEPLAPNIEFVAWLAMSPFFVPDEAVLPDIGGKPVGMLDLFPIYESELGFALEHGSEALLDRLQRAEVPPVVAPGRENVAP